MRTLAVLSLAALVACADNTLEEDASAGDTGVRADAASRDATPTSDATLDAGVSDAAEPDAAEPDASVDAGSFTVTLTASSTTVTDMTPLVLTAIPLGATSTAVNFYEVDHLFGVDDTEPFRRTIDFTWEDNGVHSYRVIASTAGGLRAESAVVDVRVELPRGNFVDPVGGSDANPGTRALPFQSIDRAAALARAGESIFLLDGTYSTPLESWGPTCLLLPADVSVRAVNPGGARLVGPAGILSCALQPRGTAVVEGVDFEHFDFAVRVREGTTSIREVHVTDCVTGFDIAGTGAAIIEAPSSGELVTAYRPSAFGVSIALVDGMGDLTVRGGRFTGDTNPAGSMFFVRGAGRLVLEGVEISDNAKPAISNPDNAQVVLRDVLIQRSPGAAAGLSSAAISMGGQNTEDPLAPSLTLERTRILDSGGTAILISYYSGIDSAISATLLDSELTNSGGNAIRIDGAVTNLSPNLTLSLSVTGSTISGSGLNGIAAGIADVDITSSSITGNGSAGIDIGSSARASSLRLRGTRISGNTGDGLRYSAGGSTSCDLGTGADPGGNVLTAVAGGPSALDLEVPVHCDAAGNEWMPNVQGADATGRYPTSTINGPASGQNYTLSAGASLGL